MAGLPYETPFEPALLCSLEPTAPVTGRRLPLILFFSMSGTDQA
jgi:hypothetical protein